MKTSYILLALIAVITLTGMVATDVLLKQQYDKIDWSNPYQDYEKRSLPTAKHWVIEGTPRAEIIVEQGTTAAQVLVKPDMIKFYRIRQQSDTLFVGFTLENDQREPPRNATDYELGAGLVLRLPDVQSIRITNGRLTLRKLTLTNVAVSLLNSRLRTNGLTVKNGFDLTSSQNSFAVLGPDRYGSLRTVVQDSSGVELNDTYMAAFTKELSPKAEVQLRGQALRWLGN